MKRLTYALALLLSSHATSLASDRPQSTLVAVRFNSLEAVQQSYAAWRVPDDAASDCTVVLPHRQHALEIMHSIREFSVGWHPNSPVIVFFDLEDRSNRSIALKVTDSRRCIELLDASEHDGHYGVLRNHKNFYLHPQSDSCLLVGSSSTHLSEAAKCIEVNPAIVEFAEEVDRKCDFEFWMPSSELLGMLGAAGKLISGFGGEPMQVSGYGSLQEEDLVITCEIEITDKVSRAMYLEGGGRSAPSLLLGLPALKLGMAAGFDDWRTAGALILAYGEFVRMDDSELLQSIGIKPPNAGDPLPPVDQVTVPFAEPSVAWNWLSSEGFYLSRLWVTEPQCLGGRHPFVWDQALVRLVLPTCAGPLPRFLDETQAVSHEHFVQYTAEIDQDERLVEREPITVEIIESKCALQMSRWDSGLSTTVIEQIDGELLDLQRTRAIVDRLTGTYKGILLVDPDMWWDDYLVTGGSIIGSWKVDGQVGDSDAVAREFLETSRYSTEPIGIGVHPASNGAVQVDVVIPVSTSQWLLRWFLSVASFRER